MGKILLILAAVFVVAILEVTAHKGSAHEKCKNFSIDNSKMGKHICERCKAYCSSDEGRKNLQEIQHNHFEFMKLLEKVCPLLHCWMTCEIERYKEACSGGHPDENKCDSVCLNNA